MKQNDILMAIAAILVAIDVVFFFFTTRRAG